MYAFSGEMVIEVMKDNKFNALLLTRGAIQLPCLTYWSATAGNLFVDKIYLEKLPRQSTLFPSYLGKY